MEKTNIYTTKTNKGIMLEGDSTEKLSYAKNMIRKNGLARKRNGWRVLYNFRDSNFNPYKINGIYEYEGRNKSCIIVHAGNGIYECSYNMESVKRIPLEKNVQLKDQRSEGFMYAGVLWLCGMGQLLIYDGESVKLVHESPLAYVPTTAVGITDKQFGAEYTVPESPNLITGQRINKLRGVKNSVGYHSFLLDTKAQYGKPFSVRAAIRVRMSEDIEDDLTSSYVGYDSDGQEINTVVYIDFHTDSLGQDVISASGAKDSNGREVTVENVSFTCRVVNGNELSFSFEVPAHEMNADNITVTFYEDRLANEELNRIEAMAQTVKGSQSVMAFSCGTSNLFFIMERGGLLYFPREDVIAVGDNMEKICGLLPMTQGSLAVYKDNSFYVLKLTDKGYELFLGSRIQGSVNPFIPKRFAADCLMLNADGIYGVKDSESKEHVYTYMKNRGRDIQREIEGFSLETLKKACACVHKEAYYLFIGGKAYVAQPSINDSKNEYDWWIFDNCSARVSASINGNLYMGREKGEVAIFDQEYKDRQNYVLTERERDFVFHQGEITKASFNYAVKVGTGTKISLDSHYSKWSDCYFDHDTNQIHIPQEYCYDESKERKPGLRG